MAMSISRPDPGSPDEVADATFSTTRRGFDQDEVRDFLRMVSSEIGRLRERERFLERELHDAQSSPDLESAKIDDEALIRLVGEETVRVLAAARESANEIRVKAEQSAARMLTEASDEAARRREDAEVEASRVRADAAKDAEAEINMAKQQGREMVNEARAYRERVLSELSRRRELAREQIEQLVAGRDRLMQAFERARLVAVDVVAELQPIGEPDEYVNLSPTTGPVPVMQARAAVPATADEQPDDETSDTADAADAAEIDEADETAEIAEDLEAAESEVAEVAEELEAAESEVAEIAEELEATETEVEEIAEELEATETEVAEIADEVEEIAEEIAEPSDDTAEAEDIATTDDTAAADDSGTTDDVVVDLFARLRSETTAAELGEVDETEPTTSADGADPVEAAESDDAADEFVEATEFEQRDADLTPLIVSGAKKLKRVLADEQNDVLERLRQSDAVSDVADLVPDAAEHTKRYVDAIRDDLLVAANAGAQLSSPSRTAHLSKAEGNAAVAQATTMLDDWLVGPMRDRLDRCVRDGNSDNALITKKIRAAYREWKTQHIDEHLDDVMLAAHGSGVLAGFDDGVLVRWAVDPRHGSCPDCDDNTLEGALPAGDPFPTGHTFAPAHPGCRCLLIADAP